MLISALTSSKSLRKLLKVGTNSILVISLPRTSANSWIENANVLRTFHCKTKIKETKKLIQVLSVKRKGTVIQNAPMVAPKQDHMATT